MTGNHAHGPERVASCEERRRFVRVRKQVNIHCRVTGASPEPTSSRDISAGGLRIISRSELPREAQVLLTATVESTGLHFDIPGRVVWTAFDDKNNRHEAGISFVGLDPLQRENIIALIATDLPDSDGSERRRFIRLRKQVRVEYRQDTDPTDQWRDTFTKNISLGGFAIITREAISSGAFLRLRLHLAETDAEPVEAQGLVLRSAPSDTEKSGFATSGKFHQFVPDQFERLVAFVSAHVVAPPVGPFNIW